jgi:uncharacterized membrane protein
MIKIFTVIKIKVRLKRKLKRYGADYEVVHQRKSQYAFMAAYMLHKDLI